MLVVLYVFTFLLSSTLSDEGDELVEQSPKYAVMRKDTTLNVTCTVKDTSFPWMSWYVQDLRGQFHFLAATGDQDEKSSANWQASSYSVTRVKDMELVLEVKKATESQTVFCTCSTDRAGETLHFGQGTRLTVLASCCANNYPLNFGQGTRLTVLEPGQEPTLPKVTIFAPSQKEIEEKQAATLVCLATDFIPDHVNISWYLYGTRITEGVKTEEFSKYHSETKSYSLTSRLRVSKQKWQDSYNQFQCKVKFYVNDTVEVYGSVISSEGCDTERVTYQREGYIGRFVYILLILKSTLYGVFVMSLMLRKKSVQ